MNRLAPLMALSAVTICLGACHNPQPGPDKSIGGIVLGAGWGAGAGAVVGNQVGSTGEGAAVGAGFGAIQGAMIGAGFDLHEDAILEQERQIEDLRLRNIATSRAMARLQNTLDTEIAHGISRASMQVLFDADVTSLRSGAVAELQAFADEARHTPGAATIEVIGHSDDSSPPAEALKMAEARARSVAAVLAAQGIAMSQIEVKSLGSTQPMASNSTPEGRQLNRRVEVRVRRSR